MILGDRIEGPVASGKFGGCRTAKKRAGPTPRPREPTPRGQSPALKQTYHVTRRPNCVIRPPGSCELLLSDAAAVTCHDVMAEPMAKFDA